MVKVAIWRTIALRSPSPSTLHELAIVRDERSDDGVYEGMRV